METLSGFVRFCQRGKGGEEFLLEALAGVKGILSRVIK